MYNYCTILYCRTLESEYNSMSTIKKGYTELFAVLNENQDMTVSDIMDKLLPIMEKEMVEKTHRYVDGRLEVFCYYHKQWEFVDQVPYGSKKNTKTGYNTMCKVGTNNWTTQYRKYKESAGKILDMVKAKEITFEEIPEVQAKYKAEREKIIPLEVTHWNEAHADPRQQTETEES